ncbi:MAG: hypothetical protein LKJ47_02620 [Bifidobacteriaceae bacterium]|jgi:hypothetical protein|nr:hypothetical protein [Bifidobacteriaceae bacterium]
MVIAFLRRCLASVTALLTFVIPLSACGSGSRCLPQKVQLSNSAPQNGDTITVSAKSGTCIVAENRRNYDITLSVSTNDGESYEHQLGTAVVNEHGGFSTRIVIPYNVPRASGSIMVSGSAFDDCVDTNPGSSASCVGYSADISVGKK